MTSLQIDEFVKSLSVEEFQSRECPHEIKDFLIAAKVTTVQRLLDLTEDDKQLRTNVWSTLPFDPPVVSPRGELLDTASKAERTHALSVLLDLKAIFRKAWEKEASKSPSASSSESGAAACRQRDRAQAELFGEFERVTGRVAPVHLQK